MKLCMFSNYNLPVCSVFDSASTNSSLGRFDGGCSSVQLSFVSLSSSLSPSFSSCFITAILQDLNSSQDVSTFSGVGLSFSLENTNKRKHYKKYELLKILKWYSLYIDSPSTRRFGVLEAPSPNTSAGLGGGVCIRELPVAFRLDADNDGRLLVILNG